jgi:VanZ family protein
MGRTYWPWAISWVWTISICTVCYFSLLPELELPIDFWNADKVYHMIAYAWLALLPMLRFRTRWGAVLAACSMVILGIILEIAQTHIPGRTFSFLDMTANGLGVLAGVVFGGWVRPKFRSILPLFAST